MYAEYAASPDNTWGTWFGQVTFPGFIPPALIFPGNGRLLNSTIPFFFWQASSEAVADYRLQVTSGDVVNGPFDIDVVIAHPTSRYQVTSGEALNDGTYKWRVTVRDAGAVNTSDSETRTLTVTTALPEQTLPPVKLFQDVRAGSLSSSPNQFTDVNGTMFFQARDSTNGVDLWKSDRDRVRYRTGQEHPVRPLELLTPAADRGKRDDVFQSP